MLPVQNSCFISLQDEQRTKQPETAALAERFGATNMHDPPLQQSP